MRGPIRISNGPSCWKTESHVQLISFRWRGTPPKPPPDIHQDTVDLALARAREMNDRWKFWKMQQCLNSKTWNSLFRLGLYPFNGGSGHEKSRPNNRPFFRESLFGDCSGNVRHDQKSRVHILTAPLALLINRASDGPLWEGPVDVLGVWFVTLLLPYIDSRFELQLAVLRQRFFLQTSSSIKVFHDCSVLFPQLKLIPWPIITIIFYLKSCKNST